MAASQQSGKRIAVIGGGWCGLFALKSFLEVGLDAVCYEQREAIGGVWVYREDKPGGVFLNTRTTASKCYLHASDYPFPEEVGHFPVHTEVLQYLNDYADHFKLRPHIKFRHMTQRVEKTADGLWRVRLLVGEEGLDLEDPEDQKQAKVIEEYFDLVAVCSGQHQVPSSPILKGDPLYKPFTGEVMHSHDYKYPTPDMREKNVLVVGGGESASDVAAEVSEVAKKTFLSIRQGVWFQDRTVGAHQPADMVFTKHQRLMGFSDYQSWLVWIGRHTMIELMWGRGGSGVKDWQPHCRYFHGFLNKSRDVVDKVALGKVQPRSGVMRIEGRKVWFRMREDQPDHIDLIIFATGYQPNVDFLPSPEEQDDGKEEMEMVSSKGKEKQREMGKEKAKGKKYCRAARDAYKLVFDPSDPTLCFIGCARPMIGSIPALAELQARWAAAVYTGKARLPSPDRMMEIVEEDRVWHSKVFPQDHRSLPQLVNHWAYSDEIASYYGAKPNLIKWFFKNPYKLVSLLPFLFFLVVLFPPSLF
ncbi:Flavin-containing monooxygenase [Balamuthia mandrillaris]